MEATEQLYTEIRSRIANGTPLVHKGGIARIGYKILYYGIERGEYH